MSSLSAFHGDGAQRHAALQRLAAHVTAGQLVGGPMVWTGETGSVVGCLVHSHEPQHWQEQLGLARWLAHALDAVTEGLAPSRALQLATEVLHAITPGQDTAALGSALIDCLLGESSATLPEPVPAGLLLALAEVRRLHRRCLGGDGLEPGAWKALRREALAATDALDAQQQPHAHALGVAVEAAAWDPANSASAVADVLRQWLTLQGLNANSLFGWTAADDAHIRQRLEQMHQRYQLPFPDEKRDVFLLLEQHHADEATRLRQYIKHGREHHERCLHRAAALLIEQLETLS